MTVEHVNYSDTLRQGTDKINAAIDQSNEAITTANDAKTTADQALANSENTQTQLDTIVINGDSSVEAAQARVDANGHAYTTLKERLDTEHGNVVTQLAEKANKDELDPINQNIDNINNQLKGIKLSELQYPYYFCHRGAANIFPEQSMEAYRSCVNMGLVFLEMDVRRSTDGTLICHHDDTMDRTTDKTGQVSYYSTMGFKSAKIDCLAGWIGTPVLFEDLLREFGNKVIYVPEVKDYSDSTAELLTDLILKYNLQDNVIIQSFSAPNLVYPISKGLSVCYLKDKTDTSPQDIVSWGIDSVGLSTTLPDSYVTDCINAGLKVYMYTVDRRYVHDKYLNLGVHGFFTNDPLWIQKKSPILEWDPFRDQVFSHGMFQPPVDSGGVLGGNRGSFVAPNKFGWPTSGTLRDFCMQGWIGELPSSFTIDFKLNFVSLAGSMRWGGIVFCTPNDYFDDMNASGDITNGYNLLVRENGSIELFKRQNSAANLVGSALATPSITSGQQVEIKLQVTPTQIIITRVDTGHAMTINDSDFRNGFVHFGRNYSGVTFENVHFTPQ